MPIGRGWKSISARRGCLENVGEVNDRTEDSFFQQTNMIDREAQETTKTSVGLLSMGLAGLLSVRIQNINHSPM